MELCSPDDVPPTHVLDPNIHYHIPMAHERQPQANPVFTTYRLSVHPSPPATKPTLTSSYSLAQRLLRHRHNPRKHPAMHPRTIRLEPPLHGHQRRQRHPHPRRKMLRLTHLHPNILLAQHLHGSNHHPHPLHHGLEPPNGSQNQSPRRRRHESRLDVHCPPPKLPFQNILLTENRATGVSVGRFIIYYYRFAPNNKDRTWDIGIAISIAEPAVHIMTACAPATKCLFRYLFPYFARSHNTTYYEDRVTTAKSQPRAPRGKFNRFSFGFEPSKDDVATEEIGMAPKKKEEAVYGMNRLSTMDSRESLRGGGEDSKSSMVEAEPQHCLGHAK
jgi:hypothetical protein